MKPYRGMRVRSPAPRTQAPPARRDPVQYLSPRAASGTSAADAYLAGWANGRMGTTCFIKIVLMTWGVAAMAWSKSPTMSGRDKVANASTSKPRPRAAGSTSSC